MSATVVAAPPKIAGLGYVQPLGSGGFADVYQYVENTPRRVVAVKVLKTSITEARVRADFESEIDVMAGLSAHPSIVSMYNTGIAVDGRPYLTMEFCPGSMRVRTKNNPASLAEVLDAGVRIAGALETAHRAGILHRDIKPSNVLISSMERPVLTDFGIAMLRQRYTGETERQAFSVPWAAPEVLAGEVAGTVSSEVWALGATLYTFASGHAPFEHPDRARNTESKMKARILQATYTPLLGTHHYRLLDQVLARAMRLRSSERYSSMHELGEELRNLQRHLGFDVTPLEIAGSDWLPQIPSPEPGSVRGPVVTSVRTASRAQRRAELRTQRLTENTDGLVVKQMMSPIKSALIGAGAMALLISVLIAVALNAGWLA